MPEKPATRPSPYLAVALGLLAFGLLAVRFSPDWWAFHAGTREAFASISTPQERNAIETAVLSGHSERGLYVLRQARDLGTEIENSVHKIMRWRLLVPGLGHVLHLPPWATLGLAHAGCLVLVWVLAAIGLDQARRAGASTSDAFALAIVGGASAPFITSMGWLGYYDSLLALGLVAVGFARSRWWVVVACLAAPWIDERFVLGLPLALWVRWLTASEPVPRFWDWALREALIPVLLAGLYTLVRLRLGGTGGSQTVSGYLREFVLSEKYGLLQRLHGAWAGLRLGWLPVLLAIIGAWRSQRGRWGAVVLAGGALLTAIVGLLTALDMSRSMVLLLPVVPLGWRVAVGLGFWRTWHVGPVAAALALALPARHVVANFVLPVDNMWTYSHPLMTAQNNLGLMYAKGEGVPVDDTRAVRWLRRPAEEGVAVAQNNLGLLYAMGRGVPADGIEASRWLRLAAEQGVASAMENLGLLYANGIGVSRDLVQAHMWLNLSQAAGQASAVARLQAVAQGMKPAEISRAVELAKQRRDLLEKKPYGVLQ